MNEKQNKKKSDKLTEISIGSQTTHQVERFGRAGAEYIKGYQGEQNSSGKIIKKGLKHISESKVNPDYEYQNLKQQAGFAAEIHYVSSTNAENIINKTGQRVLRSNDVGLGNHTRFDIVAVDAQGNAVFVDGNPVWSAQMKFSGAYDTPKQIQKSSENLVQHLAGDKWERYRGNKVLVPSEQYEPAREYAFKQKESLAAAAKKQRMKGNLAKAEYLEQQAAIFEQVGQDLTNSNISSREAMMLRTNAKLCTAKYVAKTAHRSGMEMAKAAAITASAISVSRNIVAVVRKEKEFSEALFDSAIDVGKGAACGYLFGMGDATIRSLMASNKNQIIQNLSKSALPSTMLSMGLQVGKSMLRFAKGEIDGLTFVQELGESGTGVMAASWGAAIGTAVFPGLGTMVGGMIGYMTSSVLYGAAMQTLYEEQHSEKVLQIISAIAAAALESMEAQRKELEYLFEQFFSRRAKVFNECFANIDIAIQSDDTELFSRSLNSIAIEMGSALQFKSFVEFDSFMKDKNTKLII